MRATKYLTRSEGLMTRVATRRQAKPPKQNKRAIRLKVALGKASSYERVTKKRVSYFVKKKGNKIVWWAESL